MQDIAKQAKLKTLTKATNTQHFVIMSEAVYQLHCYQSYSL